MNTNIFDFQNSESSMQFNPLFLPVNTFVGNPGTVKSFKLSNSSYLFSDIIKVFAGSTDLTKNLDIKLNFSPEISSKQIPTENVFSFNLADINNLTDLAKALNNGKASTFNLKELIALINQLSQSGQINLLKNGISIVPNNSADDKVLTSDGLKAFLNKLNNLVKNTEVKESSSKEKSKTNDNTEEIISEILNSLKNGVPVLINIIGKTETLKIELSKTDAQAIAKIPDGNEALVNSNNQINSKEIQDNKEINLPDLEQNMAPGKSNSSNIQEVIKEITAKQQTANIPSEQMGKISKAVSEEHPDQISKIVSNDQNEQNQKINVKVSDSVKFFNVEENSGKNDIYKLKFEIVNNKTIQGAKNQPDLSNTKNLANQSSGTTKNNSDSLTIENLIASKGSLKNMPDVKIKIENTSGKVKISSKNLNNQTLSSKNNIKNAEKYISKNEENIKSQIKDFPGKIKLNEDKPGEELTRTKLGKNDNHKTLNIEQHNTNKVDSDKLENQKKENSKASLSKYEVKSSDLSPKPDSNLQKTINDTNPNTEASKDIKVAGRESQSVNHKETNSNSQSTDNIKAGNSGKINLNNSSQEENFAGDLSGKRQDLLNSSEDQEQISDDRGDKAFSSYLNKIDINNIQNVRRPVYLTNFSDQMKTIDSNEIVKEISKLASDKDQKNIVLKLVPDTLGKVKIMLDISNNVIHAHAEVENEAAKSLMQNNIENLKQALAQQGMQLNSLNISLSNHQEQKSNKSYLSKRKFTYTEHQIGEIDEKEPTNVSKHYGYNTYEFLA